VQALEILAVLGFSVISVLLRGLFFYTEDGGDMFFRNMG
jgi:hypothetical protein